MVLKGGATLSLALGSAPTRSSSLTISTRPHRAALCRAVSPSFVLLWTSAPKCSRVWATSNRPLHAASCRGVHPVTFCNIWSMSKQPEFELEIGLSSMKICQTISSRSQIIALRLPRLLIAWSCLWCCESAVILNCSEIGSSARAASAKKMKSKSL
jgi:hypothetical protein